MAKAKKPMPFKLEELRKEFYDRNFFGLLMSIMLIPIVLVDHENAPSLEDIKSSDPLKAMQEFQSIMMEITVNSPLLAPRFLSMFDEMKESGLFDRTFAAISCEGERIYINHDFRNVFVQLIPFSIAMFIINKTYISFVIIAFNFIYLHINILLVVQPGSRHIQLYRHL